jgi:SAM-dependent methyltransferase
MSTAWSREGVRLASLGFATLFLELVLIRYLAGNIWNLGYFPNLVLIAVFVGMGLGFTLHGLASERRSGHLFHAAPFVLFGLVLFVYYARPAMPGFAGAQGDVGGELFFTNTPAGAHRTPLTFVVCVVAIVAVFALVSQQTAKTFTLFEPLTAYTLDIAGSCLGIASFMIVSWLRLPAYTWFVPVAALLVVAAPTKRWLPALPIVALVFYAREEDARPLIDPSYEKPFEVTWSPYQKIEYVDAPKRPLQIYVNGIPHQAMLPPGAIAKMSYQLVYEARKIDGATPYKNVLVLGAGSGNDVAAALMNGAEHVDAVEIDPVIADLGRRHHPAKPYADPRVNLVIDDGRAFMTRTTRRYDLVIFALTDSLVKVSSMSQLRLENYLFTQESVERAYSLLAPGGDIIFYNYYRYPWLFGKLVEMTRRATGNPPTVLLDADFKVLRARQQPAGDAAPALDIDVPTDDWPFLYLEKQNVPTTYVWAMSGVLAAVLLWIVALHRTVKSHAEASGGASLQIKLAFLFMGIAFLLLETKSVIQFSLLFGTTWQNNSFVFLAVLVLVLAANWTARFLKSPDRALPIVFGILFVSAFATLVYPVRKLLAVDAVWLRVVLASLLTLGPIYLANLIFSIAFRNDKRAEHVFGWNLIGATLGGVTEYFGMAVGYDVLAVVVAAAYLVAFIMLWDARRATLVR